jgi:hypothetical protein
MSAPAYLIGFVITLVAALLVVFYLRRALRRILTDLCGTQERGDFLAAFSNVLLILLPIIFALTPRPDGGDWLFDITGQLRWGLVGLALALVVVGMFICIFILARPASK